MRRVSHEGQSPQKRGDQTHGVWSEVTAQRGADAGELRGEAGAALVGGGHSKSFDFPVHMKLRRPYVRAHTVCSSVISGGKKQRTHAAHGKPRYCRNDR